MNAVGSDGPGSLLWSFTGQLTVAGQRWTLTSFLIMPAHPGVQALQLLNLN